jgi:hypothetical protein
MKKLRTATVLAIIQTELYLSTTFGRYHQTNLFMAWHGSTVIMAREDERSVQEIATMLINYFVLILRKNI